MLPLFLYPILPISIHLVIVSYLSLYLDVLSCLSPNVLPPLSSTVPYKPSMLLTVISRDLTCSVAYLEWVRV
jgi:hypothetical protein